LERGVAVDLISLTLWNYPAASTPTGGGHPQPTPGRVVSRSTKYFRKDTGPNAADFRPLASASLPRDGGGPFRSYYSNEVSQTVLSLYGPGS